MSNFKEMLKSLRSRENLSQAELAQKIGLSKSTISMYEVGKREPDFETLEIIADFFNVDMNFLLGKNGSENSNKSHGVRINVLGRVAAGIPIEAQEDIIDWEEISEDMARTGNFFALQIQGDSMEPRIKNGDVVIVKQQSNADSEQIVIAMVNGCDATCKRLLKYEDGIRLLSNNPAYEPMYFTNREIEEKPVRIVGRVVELRGKL